VNRAVFPRALERRGREVHPNDLGVERLDPTLAAADIDRSQAARQLGNHLVRPVPDEEPARFVQPIVELSGARELLVE
jgi:hypothetical protein